MNSKKVYACSDCLSPNKEEINTEANMSIVSANDFSSFGWLSLTHIYFSPPNEEKPFLICPKCQIKRLLSDKLPKEIRNVFKNNLKKLEQVQTQSGAI